MSEGLCKGVSLQCGAASSVQLHSEWQICPGAMPLCSRRWACPVAGCTLCPTLYSFSPRSCISGGAPSMGLSTALLAQSLLPCSWLLRLLFAATHAAKMGTVRFSESPKKLWASPEGGRVPKYRVQRLKDVDTPAHLPAIDKINAKRPTLLAPFLQFILTIK